MDVVFGGQTTPASGRPFRHLDPILLVSMLLLSIIGFFMIYSATERTLRGLQEDPGFYLKKQLTWFLLGAVLLLLSASVDYRFMKVYASLFYAGSLVLLLLVRLPFLGTDVKGSQRWFEIFGFQFAPSEMMKLALIAMLAASLSEIRARELTLEQVIRATAFAVFPMALVFLQPDIGTSMVLAAILVGILIVAGAKPRHLAALALAAVLLGFFAFQLGVIKEYQVARLTSFLDPTNDPNLTGYNKIQAEIAIGSGGLTGLGYLKGTQTTLDFVPEQQTDFVFTVVGEEFGFLGATIVLILYALLVWRAIRIAMLAKDAFGTYVATGVASMFAFQIFVNIGMTIGIMPITGIPLPFVSYGGSSTLINFAAVGLLLNAHMRRFT